MKRKILIEGIGKELEIGKFNVIDVEDKEFIYLEKMKDEKWRLSVTKKTIPDITKVKGLKIVRED